MQRLYQIYDKVAGCVEGPILPYKVDAAAVRAFYGILANPQTSPGQHPSDYQLLCVGAQDASTGELNPEGDASPRPVVVATGIQWLEQRNREEAARNA